jgi:hypothetical protein
MSPLPLDKKAKLVRMMQLAQSENDHEALVALRGANKILHDHRLDWDALFNAIDERKIIAWENDQGGITFRPHAWAFDQDLDEEEAKRRLAQREKKQINL